MPLFRQFLIALAAIGMISVVGCGSSVGTNETLTGLTPPQTTIAREQTQIYIGDTVSRSNPAETWRVREGSRGGSIRRMELSELPAGYPRIEGAFALYTAPMTPGTYHIELKLVHIARPLTASVVVE